MDKEEPGCLHPWGGRQLNTTEHTHTHQKKKHTMCKVPGSNWHIVDTQTDFPGS